LSEPNILEIKLTASNPDPNSYFGHAVAIEGKIAIVGAPSPGVENGGTRAGSVCVFDVSDPNNPVETYKLTAGDAEADDAFGRSVALDGNIAIVGSYRDDDVCPGDPACDSGSAYLFDVASGNQLSKLTASDAAAYDTFGYAVAISGNIVIVGAYGDDNVGGIYDGAAYLFDVSDPNNPVQTSKFTASDVRPDDVFGTSVSISGDRAIVGAHLHDHAASNAGAAYMFDVSDPYNPVEIQEIIASDAAPDDYFGGHVSISGGLAVVSAVYHDHNSQRTDSGSVYVFNDYYCIDTNSGLVGYWSFDDGTATDESSNGNHGTIYGAAPVAGVSGQALSFDGVDDYVRVPDANSLKSYADNNQLTITAWIFMDQDSTEDAGRNFWGEPEVIGTANHGFSSRAGHGTELLQGVAGRASIEGWNTTGNYLPRVVAWRLWDVNGIANDCWSTTVLNLNQWYYLTGTLDNSIMNIYVNGVLDTTLYGVSEISSGELSQIIGAWAGVGELRGLFFPGYIDEFRIYNRALNAAEIQCLYENPNGDSCNGCTVPEVVGMKEAEAQLEIIASNFVVGAVGYECHDVVPAGVVLSQDPNGREMAVAGSPVDMAVSVGTVACCDGVDNDVDSRTDWPVDLGCVSEVDVSELTGDFDNDGDVDLTDMVLLTQSWLLNAPFADIAPLPTRDSMVDLQDYSVFAGNWLEGM
jgi:hypothetical protein